MGPGHLEPNYSLFWAIRQIPAAHYPQIFPFIIKNRWNEHLQTCLRPAKITPIAIIVTQYIPKERTHENLKWYLSIFSNCFDTKQHLPTIWRLLWVIKRLQTNGYIFPACAEKQHGRLRACGVDLGVGPAFTCSRKKRGHASSVTPSRVSGRQEVLLYIKFTCL